MCSFKPGDIVKRINRDNGLLAKCGQQATVIGCTTMWVDVRYNDIYESWSTNNVSLVSRAADVASAYQFKVGDRGKTAINGGYEVLVARNGCLLVEYTREGKVVTYNITDLEGKVLGEQWLLPPARTTYWVTLRYDAPDPAAPGTQKLSELRTSEYATSGMRDVGISNISHGKGWSVVKQWEEEK